MPIYFNSAVNREPFQFDSLGIHWEQEPTRRPKGFPLYHYLQTEKGAGLVTAGKKTYFLEEDQGILLAPGIPQGIQHRLSLGDRLAQVGKDRLKIRVPPQQSQHLLPQVGDPLREDPFSDKYR